MTRPASGTRAAGTPPGSARACAVCGTPAPPPFRAPQPETAPDLDLRPGEPARSTLPQWVRVCRGCAAAAPDLTALPASAIDIVRSDAYRSCPGSPTTLPFRHWAILSPADAANALIQAAWAADDAGLDAEAADLRRAAAALWADATDRDTICRRVDALRRAGDFEDAERCRAELAARSDDEATTALLSFQRARIEARDTGRWLMSAALRPPAHAPHVSHGTRPRGGLLARLLGR